MVLWAVTRIFSVVTVLVVARQQGPNPWSPSKPGYFAYIDGWDAGYYSQIFASGYPSVLPRNADGIVEPNRWAFYPVFPGLARAVSAVTGLGWLHVAPLLATLASLGLALVLYRLFLVRTSPETAIFAVGLFLVQAAAPILGFGYAESLGLLLVAGLFVVALRGALARARHSPVELGLFGALVGFAFHELVDFNGQIPANAATLVALAALAARPREPVRGRP